LSDGTCATGTGPTIDETGFLTAVRPLNLAPDEDMLQLGNAMCGGLDRIDGDVVQLFTVDTSLPKQSVLTVVQAAGTYLCPHWNMGQYVRPLAQQRRSKDDRTGLDGRAPVAGRGESLSRACRDPYVHVNTVIQRRDRVGQLLGRDWQRPERALGMQLAPR
jgi:hypothetical protein